LGIEAYACACALGHLRNHSRRGIGGTIALKRAHDRI
jgi:hypothetical protein